MSLSLPGLSPEPILAHGEGAFRTLPLRPWVAAWAGSATVIIAFLVLYLFWLRPRLKHLARGHALGGATHWIHDGLVIVMRTIGLALFFVTLLAMWIGSTNSAQNIAPVLVYIILWIGVPLASLVLGNIWGALNPYDTLAAIAQRARRGRWEREPEPLPADGSLVASYWPAVVGLFGFIWLELCYHERWNVHLLAGATTLYSVAVLAAAAVFGRSWLQTGETFTAYFGLIARMAPISYDREARRIRVRSPFSGVSAVTTRPGITMLVLVAIGGTTFDASSRTLFWQKVLGASIGWNYSFIQTFGLLWITAAVAIGFAVATATSAWLMGDDPYDAPARYMGALVPIAYAYTFAHYIAYLIYDGQDVIRLLSDPFGKGWDLFGTADYVISFNFIPMSVVSWSRVIVIIVAHVAAITLAFDRAIERRSPQLVVQSQIPVAAVIAGYCAMALLLLLI